MAPRSLQPVTVLTPVYLDRPERWDYLLTTFGSFYRCCRYPGPLLHHLVDDRSPLLREELARLCSAFSVKVLLRMEEETRRGFFDVYRALLASVETEFFLYLEPDHYFYLPYDFLSPAIRLFFLEPDLVGVYLRAPVSYQRFHLEGQGPAQRLVTYDGARLERRRIDEENTGWIGRGYQHEGFSLMPTLWRTAPLREYFMREGFWLEVANPYELEHAVDHDWYRTGPRLVAYLNAQAFCYHVGAKGGMGGGHTTPGDGCYEATWSSKIL